LQERQKAEALIVGFVSDLNNLQKCLILLENTKSDFTRFVTLECFAKLAMKDQGFINAQAFLSADELDVIDEMDKFFSSMNV